jgi:hypothetical protein
MRMKNFEFGKYCTPAQLYLVLGAIGIIMGFFKSYSIETLLTNSLFLVIWAWVLNWLCSKGFKAISWILVLLPFIMMLFTYFLIKDVAVKEGATGLAGLVASIKPAPGAGGAGICNATCQANKAANARATCISGCKSKKNSKACEEACPA